MSATKFFLVKAPATPGAAHSTWKFPTYEEAVKKAKEFVGRDDLTYQDVRIEFFGGNTFLKTEFHGPALRRSQKR